MVDRSPTPGPNRARRHSGTPGTNILALEYEEPLFMAWWDLVGQVLGLPLHELWADLFDVGFDPPGRVPLAAYSWPRFPDADGNDAVTFDTGLPSLSARSPRAITTLKLSMTSYEPGRYVDILAPHPRGGAGRRRHPHRRARHRGTSSEARRILPAARIPQDLLLRAALQCAAAEPLLSELRRPRVARGYQRRVLFPQARGASPSHHHPVLVPLVDAAHRAARRTPTGWRTAGSSTGT